VLWSAASLARLEQYPVNPASTAPTAPRPARRGGRAAFLFIVVTVFIDMLSFAVIIPSLPFLISELLGVPVEEAVPWGGYLTTVYAIVNFLAQPVLGNLSDRFGRRPVLLISMATLGLDFLVMGLAQSITLLFLMRLATGLSGATHSTAAAYIADVTEPKDRARAYGMLGAAFGLGFILGPVIGGFLGALDPRAPFFAAAGLAGVNFLYGMFVLPESLAPEDRRPFDWRRANALGAFRNIAKVPDLRWFLAAVGLYGFAHWVYPATFSYYGPIRYGWSSDMTGLALGAVGLASAVVQGGLIGPAIRRFTAARVALFGISATVVALTGYALAVEGWMIFLAIPIGAFGGLFGPALNQIMTTRVARNAQGELQGVIGSVQAFGNILSPLVMTQTLFFFTHDRAPFWFPGAAFVLAAVITALAAPFLLRGLRESARPS
jgi:DHA1 family tetracycline resistance protein-like MFS transporter